MAGQSLKRAVRSFKASVNNVKEPLVADLERRSLLKTDIAWAAARLVQMLATAWFTAGLALTEAMKAPHALVYTYREAACAVTAGAREQRYVAVRRAVVS